VPFAVRPIGAQLSTTCAVAFFGVNFVCAEAVCAKAGDAIKTIANISVFIGFARNLRPCLIEPRGL
jgi:hypothetical protein